MSLPEASSLSLRGLARGKSSRYACQANDAHSPFFGLSSCDASTPTHSAVISPVCDTVLKAGVLKQVISHLLVLASCTEDLLQPSWRGATGHHTITALGTLAAGQDNADRHMFDAEPIQV